MILKAKIPNIIGTTQERPKQIIERRGASSQRRNSSKMYKFSSVSPIQGVLEIGVEACQNLRGYRNKTMTWKLFDQAGTELQSGSINQYHVGLNFRRVDRNRQSAEQTYFLDTGEQVFFKHGDVSYQQRARFSKTIPSE